MHIGLAGPVDLAPLAEYVPGPLPEVYSFGLLGWLARSWLEAGHRVTVYALSPAVRERQSHGAGDPLRIVVLPQRPRARHRLGDFFRAERLALTSAMLDHPAEVISAHWTYEFALAAEATRLPAFVTAHDTPLRYAWEMRSTYRWLRHSLALPAVHRATALSAVSPYVAQHLQRCLGVRRHIEVIPNGVPLGDLPSADKPRETHTPVFASALQGWGPLKNGKGLLRSFRLTRERLPGARLLMFGDGFGPDGPAARWAARERLSAGVDFVGATGRTEMLRRFCEEVDVLVHPSRVECFPMTLVETMAVGIPVVAGAHSGGVPWVLDGGLTGVLTDVDNPAKLAAAMSGLARDPARRTRLVEVARDRVSAHFQIHDVARAYVDWFSAGG
ncbi:glycosyltransferase family 4 protein [Streptomyces sp. NPDC001165]|uniref:glycosyltransferase family 4 protein n=1 Tax=Streptomyces sp. NPDC001165 TaxID=3364546 RepID=UPI0036824DBF